MSEAGEKHKSQLDGLRCYAVLLVFVFHAYPWEVFYVAHGVPYSYLGQLGVEIFFALSGFLICKILNEHDSGDLRSDLKTFYMRRILRIIPLYYTFLTLNLIFGNLPDPAAYYLFTYNFRFFLEHRGPHGECWSLCVEEQFYLLFPLLLLGTPSRWRVRMLVSILILVNIFQFWFDNNFKDLSERSSYLLPYCAHFLIGGALASCVDGRNQGRKFFRLDNEIFFALGLLCLIPWFFLVAHRLDYDYLQFHSSILLFRSLALSLMVFGLWRTKSKWLLRPFVLRPVAYLGRISYGFYLLHCTSLVFAYYLLDKYAPAAREFGFVLAFVFALVFSSISWFCLETPFNKLKKHFPYGGAESK